MRHRELLPVEPPEEEVTATDLVLRATWRVAVGTLEIILGLGLGFTTVYLLLR